MATSTIARLGVDLVANHAGFRKDLKKAHRNAHKFFGDIKRDARAVKNTVTAIGVALGLALSASAVQAKNFDVSLTKITTQVGIAREEVQGMRGDMLKISNLSGRSAKEIGEGYFFIASAGLRGSTAMRTLLASAKASAIGLGDTKIVADASTSVLNAYGSANISAAEATGILLATVREGKAEADSIAGALGKVIPMAAELGVEFHEVGASVAAMTRTGATAEQSIVQLSGILTKVIKPSQQAKAALAQVGLTTDDLRISLRNKGLFETLTMLRAKFKGNEEALTRVFEDVQAVRGVFALVGKAADENRGIFERLAKSGVQTLTDAFNELGKSDAQKVDVAWNSLSNTGVVLGGTVLPLVANAANSVTVAAIQLTDWFGALDASQQEYIVTAAAVTAAAIPAIWILGKIGGTVMIAGRFMKLFALVSIASVRATAAAIFQSLIPATIAGGKAVLLMARSAGQTAVLQMMFWADGIKAAAFRAAFFMRHPIVASQAMAAATIGFFRRMAVGTVAAVNKMALGTIVGFKAMGAAAKAAYLSISWPVVLIAAALVGAGALFWNFRKEIGDALKPVGDFLYNSVWVPIDTVISFVTRKFSKFLSWLSTKAADALDAVGADEMAASLRSGAEALADFAGGSGPVIEQAVIDAGKAATAIAGEAYTVTAALIDSAKQKFNELKESGAGLVDALTGSAGLPASPTFSGSGAEGSAAGAGQPGDPNAQGDGDPNGLVGGEMTAATSVKGIWDDLNKHFVDGQNARNKASAKTWGGLLQQAAGSSKKMAKIYKAFNIGMVIMDTARSIMAAAPSIPSMAFAAATGAVQLAAIKGQFHDGIDNVPNTGTYLLESGERVVDKRLNRDLSTYLAGQGQETINNNNSRSGDYSPTVNVDLRGNTDTDAAYNNRSAMKQMLIDIYDEHALPAPF
ncbi:MAG: phage tail tape measure protein [Kordiimonadaceae bacterium]|nr:phage tail tape measure protein [Kordiimonadaceae bacterium]